MTIWSQFLDLEFYSLITILVVSAVLFFLVRFIELAENYSYLSYITKQPPKCKKCHIKLTILKNCKHATHSNVIPFLASGFFAVLFLSSYLILMPYVQAMEPLYIPQETSQPDKILIWDIIWRDYIESVLVR